MAAVERIARERGAGDRARPGGRHRDAATGRDGAANVFDLRTPVRDYGDADARLCAAHIRSATRSSPCGCSSCSTRCGVRVPPTAIRDGLAQVSWPGRLDHRAACRTAARCCSTRRTTRPAPRRSRPICANIGGERPPLVFARHARQGRRRHAARAAAGGRHADRHARVEPRSADPDALAADARAIAPALDVDVAASPAAALAAAWRSSPRIVVAGSIFLLGDVMKEMRRVIPSNGSSNASFCPPSSC